MSTLVSEDARRSPAAIRPGPARDLRLGPSVCGRGQRRREPLRAWTSVRSASQISKAHDSARRPAHVSRAHLRVPHLVKKLLMPWGTCPVDPNSRRDAARMPQFLRVVPDEDPTGRLRAVNLGGFSTFLRGANTGDWGMAGAPARRPAARNGVWRPADQERVAQPVTEGRAHPAVGVTGALEAPATQLAALDKSGRVAIEPPNPSTSQVVPPPPGKSARGAHRLREDPGWHLAAHLTTDQPHPEGETAMSEQPIQVDGLDDDAVAAVTPDAENQTAFIVNRDDDAVTVDDDQTPAPLKQERNA